MEEAEAAKTFTIFCVLASPWRTRPGAIKYNPALVGTVKTLLLAVYPARPQPTVATTSAAPTLHAQSHTSSMSVAVEEAV